MNNFRFEVREDTQTIALFKRKKDAERLVHKFLADFFDSQVKLSLANCPNYTIIDTKTGKEIA